MAIAVTAARVDRLGVIGDIHARDVRLAAALDACVRLGVDHVAAVGDIVDGVGDLARCRALLQDSDATVVRGNHERWLLEGQLRDLPNAHQIDDLDTETLEFVRQLPATATLSSKMGSVLVCHGLGTDDMDRLAPDDHYGISQNPTLPSLRDSNVGVVVRGRTHRRWVANFDGVRVVNAGTLEMDPGFVIVDLVHAYVTSYALSTKPGGEARVTEEWQASLRHPSA